MSKLEELRINASVQGILPNSLVSVVSVQWFGDEALELTYKDPAGKVANELLYRHDEPRIEVVAHGQPWSFDGDGHQFRLVSKAHRIRLAHLFDPVLAVHTSVVEPLLAWLCDYTGQSGKRHVKTFARKKDADAFIAKAKVEVREGVHTADSDSVTIADAADLWLTTGAARGLERSTLESYESQARIHIIPLLGRVKLSRLSAPAVREFEDGLRRAGRPAATVRKIMTSLGSMLSDAQERGLVSRNVCRDLGSRRKKGAADRADRRAKGRLKVGIDIPSREEIRAIVAALLKHWRPILLTAIFTGVRASELRGLRWADVDLKANELHVRQRADRYNAIGAPKSSSGERTIPLPPIVANVLREWKLACPRTDGDFVFVSGRSQIWSLPGIVACGFHPAQVRAGVVTAAGKAKYGGLHSLRHFYASWCINRQADGGLGFPLKLVQERLGHANITMTADVYGHLFPRADDGSELASAEKSLLG